MSIPSRPVSGFVPLSDVAGAVELPGGRALTPAAPQARHHFTTLHQVNQLIKASEADADLGFMARLLALCSLPRTNPGDQKEYVRRNGPYALVMSAGGLNKLPFGTLPRLLLAWVCLGAQLAISVNNCPPPRDPRSRMTSVKRTQRKDVQKAYRVRNWREYETGLRARGSLTVWLGLTDGKLANWNSPRPTRRKPGRQRQYSHHAIETTVTLGLVFGLASRQTEGFLRSLLTLLNLDNDVPDHSTISRRKARLGKVASYERRTVKPVHLRIDSSGLSGHVGQWRTPPKARDYRKLHLAVDEHTSDVVAGALTSKRARDASRVASLVGQIERPIASAKADAAYDTGDV